MTANRRDESALAGTSPNTPPERLTGDDGWHRLHPLSPVVRTGRTLIAILVVFAGTLAPGARGGPRGLVGQLGFGGILLLAGVVSWLVTRWRVEDGDLRIETGLVRRSSQRFPLSQIQAIDIVRPAVARAFGLAELRLRMGGSTGGSGRLAYLGSEEANVVRARLLALSRGLPELTAEPAERILVSVPVGRLIGSILLSRPAFVALVFVAALAVTNTVAPSAALPLISSSGAMAIGFLTVLWRRFNGNYRLTVADASDGLRLRSGLLETTAETIPRGRIQAVRMVEPLLWRPMGWCRLEVDVAGRQHANGENSSDSRQLRPVLPVGTHAEATGLLRLILPDTATDRVRPPGRAWIKSPLRYHYLSWGQSRSCVVTTTGRLALVTSWVPMAKVQSLRLVQGPVQRALKLATLYLDTAGRNVHAAIRDRDADEAGAILVSLTTLSRDARREEFPWAAPNGSRTISARGAPATAPEL